MTKTTHSLLVSDSPLPLFEAVKKAWRALEHLGARAGGGYWVNRYSPDGSDVVTIARHEGLPRDDLPVVVEASTTYDTLSYSLWIDTMEFLLVIDSRYGPTEIQLVFMGNALKVPGKHWLARAGEVLIGALRVDTVLLVRSGTEETQTAQQRAAGVSLSTLAIERLQGRSPLGCPQLVVMDASVVLPDLYQDTHDAGVLVGSMPSGAIVFSMIHG